MDLLVRCLWKKVKIYSAKWWWNSWWLTMGRIRKKINPSLQIILYKTQPVEGKQTPTKNTMKKTRWFNSWPFLSLVGGHLYNLWKGHLSIPKRSPAESPGNLSVSFSTFPVQVSSSNFASSPFRSILKGSLKGSARLGLLLKWVRPPTFFPAVPWWWLFFFCGKISQFFKLPFWNKTPFSTEKWSCYVLSFFARGKL